MKPNVLFVMPHPDDMALACGGTALLLKDKYQIVVLCLTKGEKYTPARPDLTTEAARAAVREQEELAADAYLNARTIFFGGIDGELYADRESAERVAALITELQPKAIFTIWPIEWHPDHTAAAELVRKGMKLAHCNADLYFSGNGASVGFLPDIRVDITSCIKTKHEMVAKHRTQCPDEWLIPYNREANKFNGMSADVAYAECFRRLKPLMTNSHDFLIEALADLKSELITPNGAETHK